MNDQMNTIFGWVLASAGLALGGNIVADMYFHGDEADISEDFAWGYVIDAPEEEASADEGPSMLELLNVGTAEAGQAVFAKCTACHTIEQGGADGIGPNLYGIMGQPVGQHASGYAYSEALAGTGGVWDFDTMNAWLQNPAAFAPGTKMTFAGLSSAEERANVTLYMLSMGGGMEVPEYVPEEEPTEEEATDEAPAEETVEEAAPEEEVAAE